ALGVSFYEVEGVNEIMRSDVIRHQREGVTARHYSKGLQTEGLDVILPERLAFMTRYVPVITSHVPAAPLQLLPLEKRSRVGTGRHRKVRADAGQLKSRRSLPEW